jgi:DNA-binding transcriptional ArsR family regulator
MYKNDLLHLDTRRNIYNVILENPGIHFRELSRKLDMPITTLDYHLNHFRKRGLISIRTSDNYKRFYVKDKVGVKEKEIFNVLRQAVPRNIVLYLMFGYACSKMDLCKELDKHPSTIDFHLKKLVKLDIIKKADIKNNMIKMPKGIIKYERTSNEIVYIFKDMGIFYNLYDLLIVYKGSLPEKQLFNYFLKEGKAHLSKRKRSPYNNVNSPDDAIDTVVKLFNDIFPNPICS